MRFVIQRVGSATLKVDGKIVSAIGHGLLVFVGIKNDDTPALASYYASKLSKLRIFPDQNDKMNLSINDVGGEIMLVSNFTLYADASSNRPSFSGAANGDTALPIYNQLLNDLTSLVPTKGGVFGADMKIDLQADGPITIHLDSDKQKK